LQNNVLTNWMSQKFLRDHFEMKNAIVFGSSGFVGSHLLGELLSSSDYEQVTAVVRKPLNISHPKLKTSIGDDNSQISCHRARRLNT
jgi:thioester reductase-like protein